MSHKIKPIHPGEILHEEFLKPLKISQYRLAIDVHVPPRRINEIIHGERGISANTALRLAKYFGNSAEFWLNLQTRYELLTEEQAMESELKNHVLVLQNG
ncbi:MAG: HigA family addiction module antitoxin [Candidatus Peregrinibacteria bacterium]|nr:HigA family addiction module antitoxin [Candidatus Peregrinibacteria bacterium]